MQYVKPDVQTICFGIAMSAGSLILAGGAEGKRMALPNARILIHQPSAGFQGQSTDIEIHAREVLENRQPAWRRSTPATPGKPVEELHDDMERDRFFTPEEAIDYGLIDRVIDVAELALGSRLESASSGCRQARRSRRRARARRTAPAAARPRTSSTRRPG